MSSLGIDGIRAAAAKAAFVVFLLGNHAPFRHVMPHTQNSGHPRLQRLAGITCIMVTHDQEEALFMAD